MNTPNPLKGEEPPPAFGHPLDEGELQKEGHPFSKGKLQRNGNSLNIGELRRKGLFNKSGKVMDVCAEKVSFVNVTASSPTIPFFEGVAKGRGRLSGEAPEPLPLHRALYNHYLQPIAHTLRNRMTKAEVFLWKYALRAGQMKGYTFNRQRPVLRYVADFMCKPLRLIIEVDGSIHNDLKVKKHDAFRQAELEACGFTFLRFTNDEIFHNLPGVIHSIILKINELEKCIHSIDTTRKARLLNS